MGSDEGVEYYERNWDAYFLNLWAQGYFPLNWCLYKVNRRAVSGIHVLSTCNSKVASERTISSQVKSYSLHLQGRKKIEYDLVRRSFARYPPSNVSSISLYVLILRGHRIYITRSYLICTTSLAIIHEAIASGLPNARGAWFWLTSWAPNTKLETIGFGK
ncbi:hypothetical protein EDD85DRAFT_788637 [Armillaria nabsnona]|nr:hypothetical protein EDD85DRAFT_788637 [Armillaria nabsnona]